MSKHFKSKKRCNTFAENMLALSNKSQARNTAYYCEKAYPYLYSALAIALHEKFGWGHKRIQTLIRETDAIWDEFADSGIEETLFDVCLDKTGLVLLSEEEAMKRGYINGSKT